MRFLSESASAIAYGFISHRYFDAEANRIYLQQGSERIYLDESKDIWTHFHPSDSGNIIEQSLIYKSCA